MLAIDTVLLAKAFIEGLRELLFVHGRGGLREEKIVRRAMLFDHAGGAEVDERGSKLLGGARDGTLDLDVGHQLLRERKAARQPAHELHAERRLGREANDVAELVRVEARDRRRQNDVGLADLHLPQRYPPRIGFAMVIEWYEFE